MKIGIAISFAGILMIPAAFVYYQNYSEIATWLLREIPSLVFQHFPGFQTFLIGQAAKTSGEAFIDAVLTGTFGGIITFFSSRASIRL